MSDLAERISALSPEKRLLLDKRLREKSSKPSRVKGIPRRGGHDGAPLSFDQERLWFIDQLEPGSAANNLCTSFHLAGRLDADALQRSFDEVVRRHESLRTTFDAADGTPRQRIAPAAGMRLERVDLGRMSEADRREKLQPFIVSKGQEPFDLAAGPLFRASVLRLAETEHVLVITMHHIITDKLAHDLLWKELATLYDAYTNGRASPLAELPIQYADYALWQREWLRGEVMQSRLAYWKGRLKGAPFVLDLPADRARPALPTYRGKRQYAVQPVPLWNRLKTLSRQENVTFFMTLLAAFYVLLKRYTGEEDLLVGTPFANREMPETEGLIGFLLNMLVLRVDLSGDPTFLELLGRVREAALGAYAHNDLPLGRLIQELQPERDLSRNPLFQVAFVFVEHQDTAIRQPDLMMTKIEADNGTSNFDLMLGIRDKEKDPTLIFEYSTDLFDDATVARMRRNYETLLEGIASDPGQRLSQLPFLHAEEESQMLVGWNDTARPYPRDKCLHQLFEEQAARTPDQIAVMFEGRGLNYSELNARANRLARRLRSMGVGAGAFVGVYLERSAEMVVALIAILKAGAAYLPLDPSYPPQRLSFMLEDARVLVLLTQQRLAHSLPVCAARTLCIDAERDSTPADDEGENLGGEIASDNPAYVIYTSGSTGRPKGVQIPHHAIGNLLTSLSLKPGLSESDILLAVSSLSFDIATLELFLPLITGARLVVAGSEVVADGVLLSQMLADCGATVMQGTPATWQMLIESGWSGHSGLKMFSGGEALSRELADRLLERGASLWNFYGPTEITIYSNLARVRADEEGQPTIGRGIANTQLYVLDENLGLSPVGARGDLYVGGAGLAHGYLNRAGLTAEKFIPHPYSTEPGARLYQTGDRARFLADGRLEFLGRSDYQLKLRGFRIEAGEVEAALDEHPGLRRSVVIIRDDVAGGRGLVAYVVGEAAGAPSDAELRRFLQEKLPAYMIPSAFVRLTALPLTPSGKLDRQALPPPEAKGASREDVYVAPRTPFERGVADIWAEVLELADVGAEDNFFELGGHSLTATRVLSQVRTRFGANISLRQLFESPTVAGLARQTEAALGEGQEASDPSIMPVRRVRVRVPQAKRAGGA
jgi:amino acid adenylation domain-containing protein